MPAKAETLTVYNGTATNQYVPIEGYWADNFLKCEFVIPSSQLSDMTGGTITQLTWYMNSATNRSWGSANFQVFIKEVSSASISAFSGTTGAMMVYEGPLDGSQSTTLTINFSNFYLYDGGNLLIGVYNTAKGSFTTQTLGNFYGETVSGASVQGHNSSSLNNVSPTQQNFIPKTTFTYTPSSTPVYYPPKNLTVSNIGTNEATVTWTPGGNETSWNVEYKKSIDTNWISAGSVIEPSIILDGLVGNTDYDVRVQADYGDNNLSGWVSNSFKTYRCDDMGIITYSLSDSYGDGWNSASINVVDAATNEVIETLTIPSGGNSVTGAIGICPGETYSFVWISGSYDSECSFTIKDPYGEDIYVGNAPSSGQFAIYTYELTTTPKLTVSPTSLSFFAEPGQSDIKSFTLTGKNLTDDITATITGANGEFTAPTTISKEDAMSSNGTSIDVAFVAPQDYGTITGTLTLTSGDMSATVDLKGTSCSGFAQVTLTAGDLWGDGSGYQMLLDADATAYGTIIPTSGNLTSSGDAPASTYAEFEFKIPENADGSLTTSNIVVDNSVTILIPAGTYDWCIVNPTPGDKIYFASDNGNITSRFDNFEFEAGKTYEFIISREGTGDKVDLNPVTTPTNLIAEPGSTFADISWSPGANNELWNLRWRRYVEDISEEVIFFEGFENGLDAWTLVNTDGDNYNWQVVDPQTAFSNEELPRFEGSYCVMTRSYAGSALSPDQWMISPEIEDLGGTLRYYIMDDGAGWTETYRIYVSTSGTNISDFEPVTDDLLSPNLADWTEQTVDLSTYAGQSGHIAFRHYNCTDRDFMFIDAISLTKTNEFPWNYVNNVTSTYTIEDLIPETDYEVQVQGGHRFALSDWTASSYFTTLMKSTSLADIETANVNGRYLVEDQLVAVEYRTVGENDVYLWCKDQGDASINATSATGDQIDFLLNDAEAQNGRPWDQSNWVILKLTGSAGLALADQAKGHYIKEKTIIGTYDAAEGSIVVDGVFTVEDGDASYTKNVYCTSNFIEANLGQPGAQTGQNDQYYFFMNPKIQEVCHITYAMWDGTKFTVPSNSGFTGELTIDMAYNTNADGTPIPEPTLVEGTSYHFDAIVSKSMSKAGGYVVYPANLTGGDENIATAINTVSVNGEVIGVEYVNSLGMTSKTPFQGVNIVVTRYSDGSKTTEKKVFK